MTKENIQSLIAKAKVREAISELKEVASENAELLKQVLSVESKYNELRKQVIKGVAENENRRQSQIVDALLEITEKAFTVSDDSKNYSFNPSLYAFQFTLSNLFKKPAQHFWIWLLVGVFLIALFNLPQRLFSEQDWISLWTADRFYVELVALLGVLFLLWLKMRRSLVLSKNRIKITSRSNSPIKGLQSFDFQDADIFKSLQRKGDIENCIAGILQNDFRFGILSGESGCGKTSFVRAGLHAAIKEKGIDCVVVKLKNEAPLSSIQNGLIQQMGSLATHTSFNNLFDLLQHSLTKTKNNGLVLILDQFEQFFTHQKTSEDRAIFIEQLKYCYKELPQVKILISLRRDFTGRLHEIQESLDYQLRARHNYFDLKKFTPQQAATIFQVMAKAERVAYEADFLEQMCAAELASREDSLISAVDIQIIAFIIKGQQSENKAFTKAAFQKMGGIDGLLQRFLQEQLNVPNYYNTEQAALKVLLAFIDLDNNVRVGELGLVELKQKLSDSRITPLLLPILDWLEELRLITKTIMHQRETKYELAHERLILPICNLAGKTLDEVEKANQILNKRTNEWLVNDKKARFLPSWKEYRLIQQQKQRDLIRWGNNKEWKEQLLVATQRKFKLRVGTVLIPLVFFLSFLGLQQSQWYVFERAIPNTFAELLSKQSGDDQKKLIDSLVLEEPKYVYQTITNLNSQQIRDYAALKYVSRWTDFLLVDSTRVILEEVKAAANGIENIKYRFNAIHDIAKATAQIRDTVNAQIYLKNALKIANDTKNASHRAIRDVAQVAAQIGDTQTIKNIFRIINNIDFAGDKSNAIQEINQAIAQMGDTISTQNYLKNALKTANQTEDIAYIFDAIPYIAKTAAQIGDAQIIKSALQTANKIDFPIYRFYAIQEIIQAALQIRDTLRIQIYLKNALKTTEDIEDAGDKRFAINYITQVAVQIGNIQTIESVLQIAENIEDAHYKSDAISYITQAAAQIGDTQTIKRVLQYTKNIEDDSYKSYAIDYIAQAAAQIGDTQIIKNTIQIANDIEDDSYKSYAIVDIAQATAQIGDTLSAQIYLKNAVQIANNIESTSSISSAIRDIAQTAAQIGNAQIIESTLQLTNNLKSASDKSDAIGYISQATAQIGDTLNAQVYLKDALKIVKSIKDTFSKSNALRKIIQVAAQIRDMQTIENTLQIAKNIENIRDQSSAIREIAQAAAQVGDVQITKITLQIITNSTNSPRYKATVICGIIQTATQTRDIILLNQIKNNSIKSIDGDDYKVVVQEALVQAYLQLQQYQTAYQVARMMPDSNTKYKATAYLNLMKAWRQRVDFVPNVLYK